MKQEPAWAVEARALPLGGHKKLPHDCGEGKCLVVFHNETKYTAYCHRCGPQPPVWKPLPTLQERREAAAAQGQVERAIEADRRPPQPAVFDLAEWPLEARVWLFKAGLSHSEIRDLGAYYHPPTRRVVIPVIEGGRVTFWQARRIFGTSAAKYLSMPGGRETALPLYTAWPNQSYILTEDLLSSFKIRTAGFTGLCLMGTSLLTHTQNLIMESRRSVGIWLDPDPAGQNASAEIQRRLNLLGINTFNIVSERDPKLHSKAEIHEFITRHIPLADDEISQGLRQAHSSGELASLG